MQYEKEIPLEDQQESEEISIEFLSCTDVSNIVMACDSKANSLKLIDISSVLWKTIKPCDVNRHILSATQLLTFPNMGMKQIVICEEFSPPGQRFIEVTLYETGNLWENKGLLWKDVIKIAQIQHHYLWAEIFETHKLILVGCHAFSSIFIMTLSDQGKKLHLNKESMLPYPYYTMAVISEQKNPRVAISLQDYTIRIATVNSELGLEFLQKLRPGSFTNLLLHLPGWNILLSFVSIQQMISGFIMENGKIIKSHEKNLCPISGTAPWCWTLVNVKNSNDEMDNMSIVMLNKEVGKLQVYSLK